MAGLNLQDIINQNKQKIKQNNNNVGAGTTNSTETKVQQEKFIVTMIPVEKLHDNVKNSFGLREVESLADSILLLGGIKQNLIVREREDGEYTVVAGHKRKAAVEMLVKQGKTEYRLVPCKIENYIKRTEDLESNSNDKNVNPEVLEELDLIFTNTTQREQTIQERMTAVKRLRELIPQLPGMEDVKERTLRKLIADTMKLSEGSIAAIDNINRNLCREGIDAFGENKINLETAKELAGLTEAEQKMLLGKETITAKAVKEYKKQKEEDKTRLTEQELSILYNAIDIKETVAKIRFKRETFTNDFINNVLSEVKIENDEDTVLMAENGCMRIIDKNTGETKEISYMKIAQQVIIDYEKDKFSNMLDDTKIESITERILIMNAISESARTFGNEIAVNYNNEMEKVRKSFHSVMIKEMREEIIQKAIYKIIFYNKQDATKAEVKTEHKKVIFNNPELNDKGIYLYTATYADQPVKIIAYKDITRLVSAMSRMSEYRYIEPRKTTKQINIYEDDITEERQKNITDYKAVIQNSNTADVEVQKAAEENIFLTDKEVKNILIQMMNRTTVKEERRALEIALDRFDKFNL